MVSNIIIKLPPQLHGWFQIDGNDDDDDDHWYKKKCNARCI